MSRLKSVDLDGDFVDAAKDVEAATRAQTTPQGNHFKNREPQPEVVRTAPNRLPGFMRTRMVRLKSIANFPIVDKGIFPDGTKPALGPRSVDRPAVKDRKQASFTSGQVRWNETLEKNCKTWRARRFGQHCSETRRCESANSGVAQKRQPRMKTQLSSRSNHQNSSFSESLGQLDKLVLLPVDRHASLNLVLVYEDAESREWARAAHDRLARLARKHPVRPTLWKLNNLSEPGVLAAAVSTAMRADIIVVAMRSEEGLPLPFYAWVNNWLPHRLHHGGVLAALIGRSTQRTTRSGRVGGYLRSVARQARLGFVLAENKLASPDLASASPNGVNRLQAVNGHHRNLDSLSSAA